MSTCDGSRFSCKSPTVSVNFFSDNGTEVFINSQTSNNFTLKIPINDNETDYKLLKCKFVVKTTDSKTNITTGFSDN